MQCIAARAIACQAKPAAAKTAETRDRTFAAPTLAELGVDRAFAAARQRQQPEPKEHDMAGMDLLRRGSNEMPVHPVDALFPDLDEDDLANLAADIKAIGLLRPIIIGRWQDAEGHEIEGIIDGRQRLRACEIAGIEPRFERLDKEIDPVAFIMSCNLVRTHRTKGQNAMMLAMAYPKPTSAAGGRGKKDEAIAVGFSAKMLQRSRMILRDDPALAEGVLDGSVKFEEAYNTVAKRMRDKQVEEAQHTRLKKYAPDLALKVTDAQMTVAQASAEFDARQARLQQLLSSARFSADFLARACQQIVADQLLEQEDIAPVLAACDHLRVMLPDQPPKPDEIKLPVDDEAADESRTK